ncbi:minichromosome maintenance- protein [Pleodorina starrii]|nr:minichromosome maintenance- protein [Pleodorina starrii]
MDDEDLDLLLALADEVEEEPPAPQLRKQASLPAAVDVRGIAQQRQPSQPPAFPAAASRGTAPQPTTTTAPAATASAGLAAVLDAAARSNAAGLRRSTALPSGPSQSSMGAPAAAAARPHQQPQPSSSRQVFDGYTDRISGFRVSKPVIGSLVLKERLTDDCVYIGLKDISPSRELTGRWATMAVLVSKVQATGRGGDAYSRWTLSDLTGKQVTLFLWRTAASDHYKEAEGSLLLLWSPQVRRDEGGGGGGAGFSLHIDKPEMLQRPGMSADFGMCRGTRKDGQRCTMPVNKNSCEYCPYHAQAALRALSSNRSDMAGANLLQRQLLPQARAAQKHLSATTGKPLGGINSLIARPPPPKLLPVGGGGAGLARSAGSGGGMAAAMAAGTGAYGVSVDADGGGEGGGAVGGKRSYGAQLLANLQERQTSLEAAEGGPAAKRQRSSADPWDDKPQTTISATKARAIAAARAAGQLGRTASDGSGAAGGSGGTAAAGGRAASAGSAAPGAAAPGAARRPPSLSTPRISLPPPLPAHIASLLKTPAAEGGARRRGESEAGRPSATAAAETSANQRQQRRTPEPAAVGRRVSASGEGAAAAQRSAGDGGGGGGAGEEAMLEVEEEEELLVVELEDGFDDGGDAAVAAAARDKPGSGTERGREPGRAKSGSGSGEEEIEKRDDASAQEAAAAGGGSGSGGGQRDDVDGGDGGCGLDELLEMFPELQDDELSAEEAPAAPQASTAARRPAGSCGGGGGTGAQAAAATGLLPRVAGLAAPPAARAAEARKQQAATAKARNEKLKSLGLKGPAAAPPPPAKPLGAANASSGAYGGGGRPQGAASGVAAAVALAAAKGLPMPRAAAARAAAAAAQPAAAAAAGPSSALAAAFGSLVQRLPETAVESRYSELSEEAAGDAVLAMLEGLEARDALVQQLDSITHLKVTAWHCADCNRLSEFFDKQCKAEGHNLSKTSTLKRFWTCDHCNARITTLGVRFPANRCSRCNNPSLEFTACTMYRGPRELKPAGMAAATGLASKENLFATIEQHPEIGRRTFR